MIRVWKNICTGKKKKTSTTAFLFILNMGVAYIYIKSIVIM